MLFLGVAGDQGGIEVQDQAGQRASRGPGRRYALTVPGGLQPGGFPGLGADRGQRGEGGLVDVGPGRPEECGTLPGKRRGVGRVELLAPAGRPRKRSGTPEGRHPVNTPCIGGASRPSAGALRLVEGRTGEPRTVDISDYLRAVAAHCPFLMPSVARGLIGWTVYEISADAQADDVEAEVFQAGVQAAEWIRPLTTRRHGPLVCENIVLLGGDATAHRALLAWPHWALKHLYGPVGLMFGKFWTGEEGTDRQGRRIPAPPFSFLAARCAVPPVDPRFLTGTPDLAQSLSTAVDDGRNVFQGLPYEWKAVKKWASSLLSPQSPVPPAKRSAASRSS